MLTIDKYLHIGAMTSLRAVETSPLLRSWAGGMLARSVADIVGVQFRNGVTLGGSVAGRYPFSDPIAALLALDASVQLHNRGIVGLEEFLEMKGGRDIVVQLILAGGDRLAAFTSLRRTRTDYAVLNCAVSMNGEGFRVVVGARPGRAVRVREVEEYLGSAGLDESTSVQAGHLAARALQFGDNARASGRYRRAICPVLVKRALQEVLHAA